MQRRAKSGPIFDTDFSVPLSETVEGLRKQVLHIRGQLSDIGHAYPGWGERTKDITRGVVVMYDLREAMRQAETELQAETTKE